MTLGAPHDVFGVAASVPLQIKKVGDLHKVRFEYALRLMARGISVVMIDADVFFRPSCAAPAPTRTDPTKILR